MASISWRQIQFYQCRLTSNITSMLVLGGIQGSLQTLKQAIHLSERFLRQMRLVLNFGKVASTSIRPLGHGSRHQSGRVIHLGLATDAMTFRAHLDTMNICRAGSSGIARTLASVTCIAGAACRMRAGTARLAIEPFRGECVSRGVSPSEMQQRTYAAREPQEWLERWLRLLELQEWAYERELELIQTK